MKTASHNQCIKRKLVRSFVLSLFNHTGAWSTLSVDRLFKWQNAIELAVLGSLPSQRSRFLVWALPLGPNLDPEFDLDSKVILHLLWLIKQQLKMCTTSDQVTQLGLSDIPVLPPRCQKVFTKWQWEQTSFSHFRTPFGDLDLLFHGEHTVRQIMRPRIIQDAPDLQSKVFVLTTQQAWLKSGNHRQICTALGAGNHAHKLAKKLEKYICCSCGRDLFLLVTISLSIFRTVRSQRALFILFILQRKNFSSVLSPNHLWCLVCLKFVSPAISCTIIFVLYLLKLASPVMAV